MGKYASARNLGFGKNLDYAGREALHAYYADGHFGSVAAHGDRWNQFAHWAKAEGIKDLSKADQQATAERDAQHVAARVQAQDIGIQYGQNLISTVNVTFAALRGDDQIRVSPSAVVGERSQVRTLVPGALDRERVNQATAALRDVGMPRAAAVLALARDFGVRREEAVKADLDRWQREADRLGRVNVQDGTKGGRTAPRWVPVGERQRETLQRASDARPNDSRNLIAPHATYAQVAIARDSELNVARAILHAHGIPGYHDARAAYACERYRTLAGREAPVVTGERPGVEQRQSDAAARAVIAQELGHGRTEVVSSYLGGSSPCYCDARSQGPRAGSRGTSNARPGCRRSSPSGSGSANPINSKPSTCAGCWNMAPPNSRPVRGTTIGAPRGHSPPFWATGPTGSRICAAPGSRRTASRHRQASAAGPQNSLVNHHPSTERTAHED